MDLTNEELNYLRGLGVIRRKVKIKQLLASKRLNGLKCLNNGISRQLKEKCEFALFLSAKDWFDEIPSMVFLPSIEQGLLKQMLSELIGNFPEGDETVYHRWCFRNWVKSESYQSDEKECQWCDKQHEHCLVEDCTRVGMRCVLEASLHLCKAHYNQIFGSKGYLSQQLRLVDGRKITYIGNIDLISNIRFPAEERFLPSRPDFNHFHHHHSHSLLPIPPPQIHYHHQQRNLPRLLDTLPVGPLKFRLEQMDGKLEWRREEGDS